MPKRIPQHLKAYHLLLVRTGGYTFLRSNLLKLGASILIILGLFYLIDGHIINIDDAMAWVTKILSPAGLMGLFFLSEVSFGFITPELLIVWADETLKPNWMLALLAALSYTAGIVSYFIGRFWSTRKIVRERILERNATTMDQLRRFGRESAGALINSAIVGAVLGAFVLVADGLGADIDDAVGLLQHAVIRRVHGDVGMHVAVARVHMQGDEQAVVLDRKVFVAQCVSERLEFLAAKNFSHALLDFIAIGDANIAP